MKTVLLSSLTNVLPNDCPSDGVKALFGLKNEPISFQLAFRAENTGAQYVYPRVTADIPVKVYSVGYVMALNVENPGAYPDRLIEKQTNPELVKAVWPWYTYDMEKGEDRLICATDKSWQSLWFTVNESEKVLKGGVYPVKIELFECRTGKLLSSDTVKIELSNSKLQKQKLMYTCWFHCDCICDAYGVRMFSDEFFKIFRNFVRVARMNGQNMLLLPAFTPPLDTGIGRYRKKAQLVGVKKTENGYSFDFSLMKRFIDEAKAQGIEYFEHSHLFTQWGAAAAPAVYAEVDGSEKRIFGWNTKAYGKAYQSFLDSYLTGLFKFMKEEKLENKILFHISDEPTPGTVGTYRKTVKAFGDKLKGQLCGDAMSDIEFYREGLVKTPIVGIRKISGFIGECDDLWCYYTGDSGDEFSNRLIGSNPCRNRSLGLPLYYYGIKGFLNWGYNYWYSLQSLGFDYPQQNAELFNNHLGGNSIVYPARNGKAEQSTRQKVFYEGINDIRALQTLEKEKGRTAVEKLLKKHFGCVTFNTIVTEPAQYISFRKELNRLLK